MGIGADYFNNRIVTGWFAAQRMNNFETQQNLFVCLFALQFTENVIS